MGLLQKNLTQMGRQVRFETKLVEQRVKIPFVRGYCLDFLNFFLEEICKVRVNLGGRFAIEFVNPGLAAVFCGLGVL